MKLYINILLLVFTLYYSNSLRAQTSETIQLTEQTLSKDGKYAMMVMKVQHLKAGFQTAKELKEQIPGLDFQIVTCGALVKEIATDKALQELIIEAQNDTGLKVLICGYSIKQLNIDKTLIPSEISTTENGLIYMFGLQELGYNTIIL